ncbi:hypothetical protein CERSUDRAFT_119562 [Gelatoporia subvermispora B]|uniref:Uncharacterized protein n=1 Tax=Ceriporiopsis subvermispora (strain B) TaxID=914234 RepID=M2Q4H8_CERS8|nr:hypothetical protein CERSUDRAFT_119562 [Gelatoporia subvermispora B]
MVPIPRSRRSLSTHDDVLGFLGEALAMNGWPCGDEAIQFELPEDEEVSRSQATTLQVHNVDIQRKHSPTHREQSSRGFPKRRQSSKNGGGR